jgi:signal transduction histidine kinase/ActR/RegA family two-component response regulator
MSTRQSAVLKKGALQNAILNSASFSSIATDEKGIIQIFNVGAERMLGYKAADVINCMSPSDISDSQENIARAWDLSLELGTVIKPGFEAMVFKASRGIEDIYELTYICQDQTRLPAIVSVTALRDARSTIIGYLLIATDNTARKLIEAERQQAQSTLQIAMQAAEKANLAKSDFLSSMSHELRTPLSAILGFAQLLETSTPDPSPSQQRCIMQILKAGWYLLDLINEILDLALVESGKLSLSMEPLALENIMQECQAMVETQARERGISVSFPDFSTLHFVNADRTRMKQILINLLSNALKYNRERGAVTVSLSEPAPGRVRISVEDEGEGLSPSQISQLFQPFNRLGQETKIAEGTGIGLVMTKRLIEMMGGEIGVLSTLGTGSCFWVELDIGAAPELLVERVSHAPQLVREPAQRQHLMLYVEDNPANLMLVEDLIGRRQDIRLISATDGIKGLDMALQFRPDLILLDINLPGINGIRVLEILRADARTANIPVVALSANAMPRDIERGMAAGFFRYLTKPIVITEFMATLDQALEH